MNIATTESQISAKETDTRIGHYGVDFSMAVLSKEGKIGETKEIKAIFVWKSALK